MSQVITPTTNNKKHTDNTNNNNNEILNNSNNKDLNNQELLYGQYATKEYWEKYYESLREEEGVDWYIKYEDLSGILEKYIQSEDRILHVGAGSSKITYEIYMNIKCKSILSTDISENLINVMSNYESFINKGLIYETSNVLDMKYQNESFEVVIEKALLDSILCKKDGTRDAFKMLKEVHRVLVSKGYFICISHGDDESRLGYFDKNLWEEVSFVNPCLEVEIENINLNLNKKTSTEETKKKSDKKYEFYCFIARKK